MTTVTQDLSPCHQRLARLPFSTIGWMGLAGQAGEGRSGRSRLSYRGYTNLNQPAHRNACTFPGSPVQKN